VLYYCASLALEHQCKIQRGKQYRRYLCIISSFIAAMVHGFHKPVVAIGVALLLFAKGTIEKMIV